TLGKEELSSTIELKNQYQFFGRSILTLYESTDSEALTRFAEHFGISQITLESFRSLDGQRIMCGDRQVFPPPNANA
ncbi:MAG: hypothetical protein Q8S35_01555, partial [bacterium]|nr:hypothetical protein [bacterium]